MSKNLSDVDFGKMIRAVLESTHAFCADRDNCKGCPYMIMPAPGRSFATCVLEGTPDNWKIEKLGGEHNEQ